VKKEETAASAASEKPAPTYVKLGDTPEWDRIRVVDAETGKQISHVLEADSEKGFVRRFAVEHGNFVREGSNFKIIEEDRKVRLEWIEDAA
jgi:hypothetical protein